MLRPILGFVGVCQFVMLNLCLTCLIAFAQTSSSGLGNEGSPAAGNNLPDRGNAGGVTRADFDPLLNLIQSTIGSEQWLANGGNATLLPYVGGVFADANGTLRFQSAKPGKNKNDAADDAPIMLARRAQLGQHGVAENASGLEARIDSELRFVSLRSLESFIASHVEKREALPEEVLTLAGLQAIRYVVVVPESDNVRGDLVLAGPAGDWKTDLGGILVSTTNGHPTIRLDDLLALWRRPRPTEPFGVTIEPRAAGLESLQQYLKATTAKPIKAYKRKDWVEGIRESVGEQDVRYFGLRAESHVAKVLLTADYHMKCIGMGLAEPVAGMKSYLKTVKLDEDGQVPPMTVLRWWFAMNYDPVLVSENEQVFELRGFGAKVLSENQLLLARGQRIGTGKSEPLNRRFAETFTKQFPEICDKYPLYGELKNVFDLSMMLAVIEKQQLLERANWRPSLLLDTEALKLPKILVADEVAPVVNHRVIRGKQIVVGVSGGVWVDAKKHLKVVRSDSKGELDFQMPKSNSDGKIVWWWD
jgi:hypothetical protein